MCCRRLAAAGLLTAWLCAAGPRVAFSPFPSDSLTAADPAQRTGRRVSLPLSSHCAAAPGGCADLRQINALDGFHRNPRIEVRFSAPVEAATLRAGIFLVALEAPAADGFALHRAGERIAINQVVYDPATNTASARPDGVLDQQRRYALVVTDAVRGLDGAPAEAEPAFADCLSREEGYCGELRRAVAGIAPLLAPARIAGGSVFTTLSATAWLEAARRSLGGVPPAVAPSGVLEFPDIVSVTLRRQTGVAPARFEDETLPAALLNLIPVGVAEPIGKIAFATFQSPRFTGPRFEIAPQPSAAAAEPVAIETVAFHALLPSRPRPAGGYPVVIFGHGFTDSRFGGPTAAAPVMTAAGFAVVAINAYGHGSGPLSSVVVQRRNGQRLEIPAPGRGVDADGDGRIGDGEGCLILAPEQPIGLRDCLRQTAADLMQLVRAIGSGPDLDGDGRPDFDASRIYYAGMSLGAMYGALLGAAEPEIQGLALNVGGGPVVEIARLSDSFRKDVIQALAQLGLLNRPGEFADEMPGRHEPVKIVRERGAVEIQEALARLEWLQAAGDPLSFAPHLAAATLPGVPARRVLWQLAKGDRTVPLSTQAALVRAANMRESAWLFRNDWASEAAPSLPENPHAFLANLFSLPALPIALAAQQQMAAFFASGAIPDPNPTVRPLYRRDLFEIPGPLSEELNY